ncbi:hypothetical protein CkaCkLH20_05706 [Colletotrichum karsti]|uniref:Peptidase S8/S53 domain-containing protein n=1 Tax=Colletotrichum karsti TaxID=1095194 RepID=A0A9P6I6N4_9PEZI|nr:uncharacterized protein CkaCkLH20_05706 [Colletotrichum karsti]KAF9876860.1 hypothetical protein CkaCkLH20_05706 [Colletotrichum karsti]
MTAPDKTSSQVTDGGPDSTLEATKTTESPPSETSKTDDPDTPFDHTWLPLPVVVKINGAEYYPPTEHEEPIDIFLNDGSTAVLAYKSLKIGDRTINIPDKAPAEPQTIDGVQIAQRSFDSSGGSGSAPGSPAANPFDAMKGIFSGLSASAGPLAMAVSGFSAKAVRVALNAPGGPLSETGFSEAIELQDLAQDAMNLAEQATQFQNQLEAARMSQAGQADLFKPINGVVFSAYPKVRASTNLLRSVAQMLQNLPNIHIDIQGAITQRLSDMFVKGVASVGFVVEAYNIYAILHNIDWDNIVVPVAGGQQPSSSTVFAPASSTTTSPASTSSPAVQIPGNDGKGRGKGYLIPIPTGPTSPRIIDCKFGAVSPLAFRNFVKWLDGTSGHLLGADDIIPTSQAYPSYLTNLTVVQEEAIKTIPWVRSVAPNHWILSGDINKDYRYDPSLGSGTTIFIVDSGFNTGHQELARGPRSVEAWFIGNKAVLEGNSYYKAENLAPEDTEDYSWAGQVRLGHGSAVACVAGGRSLGVASNANLYLVKHKGAAKQRSGKVMSVGITRNALQAALDHIHMKVLERRLQGKAVVNLSFGINRNSIDEQGFAILQANFESFVRMLDMNGVVFVMSAGNDASIGVKLGDHLPQLLGTETNHLITVGGVHADGTLWHNSEPEGRSTEGVDANSGGRGSVTVYAQSKDVIACNGDPSDTVGTTPRDGTSFAAPAVAGLAAYFLGHPYYSGIFTHDASALPEHGSVGLRMKNFLQVWASFQRRPAKDLRPPDLAADYPMPERVRVAYNLINDRMNDVAHVHNGDNGNGNGNVNSAHVIYDRFIKQHSDSNPPREAKRCKLKALPISIIPIVFRQCECVDPLKEKEVPEFCVIDEDCQALACDASKDQEKSCVTVVPMGGSLPPIRKCKCTDPQTSTSTTSTTSPKPPPTPTTVEPPPPASPTQILPSREYLPSLIIM